MIQPSQHRQFSDTLDKTNDANSTAAHFNLIRESAAYQEVEREAGKDLEALQDVDSTPALIFDRRLPDEKRIKILGELLQSTLLASEHRGGYQLENLNKLCMEFEEDTGLHLDLILHNFGFPSMKAFIQSNAMAPYTHILKNSEGETIVKGKQTGNPLLGKLMNDQLIAGQSAKKKELQEQNEYATRIQLALRDPKVLKHKLMMLEVIQELGGDRTPIEYGKVQTRFKEKFQIELNKKNCKEMFNVGHAKNMLSDVFNGDLRVVESSDSSGMLFVKLYDPFEVLKQKYEELRKMQDELGEGEAERCAAEEDKIDNPRKYRIKGEKKEKKVVDIPTHDFMKPSKITPMEVKKITQNAQEPAKEVFETTENVTVSKKTYKRDGKYSAPAVGQDYSDDEEDDEDEEEEMEDSDDSDQLAESYTYKPKPEARVELAEGGDLDDAFGNDDESDNEQERTVVNSSDVSTTSTIVEKTYIKETKTEAVLQSKVPETSASSSSTSSPEIIDLPKESPEYNVSNHEVKRPESIPSTSSLEVGYKNSKLSVDGRSQPQSPNPISARSQGSRTSSTSSEKRNEEYLVKGVGVRNKVAEYEIFMFIKGLIAGVYPNPMHTELVMEKLLQFMPQNPYVHDVEILERIKKLPFLQVINDKFLLLLLPDSK
uniref:HTH OST-type domain-containing protein n=1 Tax=Bursaphelenchus xylophilus TaxID=6326 RepID=A0A1I7SM55_BURXY